jgi:cell wall-associated NlpC family hydrolase
MNFPASKTGLDTTRYVGLQFPDCSAGCYWLLREVYRNELGIELDEDNLFVVEDSWSSAIESAKPQWVQVYVPQVFDAVLMYAHKSVYIPTHVGVYVGDGKVLHMRRKTGAVVESLAVLERAGLVEGFYRYKGLMSVA